MPARKLKSENGLSILMSLIFLLLCSMISVVVLSAASNALGKHSNKEQYQHSLSLSSAAELILSSFNGTICDAYESQEAYSCGIDTDSNYVVPAFGDVSINTMLAQKLCESAYSVYLQNTLLAHPGKPLPIGSNGSFTIKAQGMDDVTAVFEVLQSYDIIVTLSLAAFPEHYTLELFFKADTDTIETSSKTNSCSHEVTVTDPLLGEQTTTVQYEITKTDYTTTISWQNGSVTGGAR